MQERVFSEKKSPRQGCTTQNLRVGMQQQIVLPESKYQDIQIFHLFRPAFMGPFSENHTLHGGAERPSPAAFPKSIPMQAGRGLRGPLAL